MKKWLDKYQSKGEVKNSLNRKVTCSNCGWSWKLSDGGEDPLTCHKCGGTIKMKHGGELDKYKEKGEVKSTFNPYENVNRVGTSDNTKVYRVNPEQVEKAKKAAAIKNEKIVQEYQQNQRSFIGPDKRTKAEIDKGIALKKEYDRVKAMQNSDLAKTFASFTPGNNIEAGVMGAETFANLNPIISGPILATSRLAPAILHPTNNAYWGSGRSNLENGLGALGAVGDISMVTPFFKGLNNYKSALKTNNYLTNISNKNLKTNQLNLENQLPPIPSEIHFMPNGKIKDIYNQRPIINYELNSYKPDYAFVQKEFIDLRRPRPVVNNTFDLNKLKPTINKSGLTKNEVLNKIPNKDKDAISKMSEQEFENTVLKPDGQIVNYKPGPELDQMTYDLTNRRMILKDNIPLTEKEYADEFNQNLDLLNDIIAKKNKSGIEYKVKGLDEKGSLKFYTPKQDVPVKLDKASLKEIEEYKKNPLQYLIDKADLTQIENNKWLLPHYPGKQIYNSLEEVIEMGNNLVKDMHNEKKAIEGETTWGVKLNPGKWKGDVEDIANTEYFRSIPGLEMSNTSQGVFSDNIARKGSGAYESINEYLKRLDLGRVKAGFNSQTEYSRNAWENFIKSGRGVGFYNNPRTVYGSMKTTLPYIGIGAIGAGALNQKQEGGAIITNRGQWDYPGQTTIIPSNQITMQGVPYPVLGVDNTGYTQMMQPQMDYTFPGQYVTEYPMAQNGKEVKKDNIRQAYIDAYNNYSKRKFPAETLPIRQKAFRTVNPSSYLDFQNYNRWNRDEQRDVFYDPRSEEAWNFYLGLSKPEDLKYIRKSQYRPTINATDQNYYALDPELEQDIFNTFKDKVILNKTLQTDEGKVNTRLSGKNGAGALGRFGVSRGHDENGDYLSYYDKYDLKDFAQDEAKGMPYSIYNRIYYPKKQYGGQNTDWEIIG